MKLMNTVKTIVDNIKKNFYLICGVSLLLLLFILQRSTQPGLIEGHNLEETHTHDKPIAHMGPIGEQGNQGERGEIGLRGPTGEKGVRGKKGKQGEQGIKGEMGIRGPRGYNGDRGKRGFKGRDGDSTFTEREEDLIRDAVMRSQTLERGLAQTQAEISNIKTALEEDPGIDDVYTMQNTEDLLVEPTESLAEETVVPEGFLSRIFGFGY